VHDRRRAEVFEKLREYGRQPPDFTFPGYQSPAVSSARPGKATSSRRLAKARHTYSATGHSKGWA
jgi:hypothetical protein